MNLFLKGFYRFMQALAIVSLGLYFRRIIFLNKKNLKTQAPLLVISNHPNTVVDPLVSLMWARERCFLLANYSLFKNPITNWLLTTLYCIPVQRPQDVDGVPVQNDEAFRKCDEHLLANGSIYIAAEGTSYTERHIREFKTGAARIAFSAESLANFQLNLQVLLVGITYFNPLKPNSDIIVEVAEPFSVDDWQEVYSKNPRTAVQEFTDFLENKMKTLVINCRDVEEDEYLKKLEVILQSDNPLTTEGVYNRSKKLLEKLHSWQDKDESGYILYKNQVEYYFSNLKKIGLHDANIVKSYPFDKIILLILGLPIFLYGFINNVIPTWISNKMISVLNVHSAYDTTIRYCAGIVFFPLLWWLQTELIEYFVGEDFSGWIYLLTVIPTGLAARWLYTEGIKYFNYLKYKMKNKNNELTLQRSEITGILYKL